VAIRTPSQVKPGGERSLCDKGQLVVVDDPVHHGLVSDEDDDRHFSLPSGARQEINLIDFSCHTCQAAVGNLQK